MRIPLDFYRILGVPIQATPEQLVQAHNDRLQQFPHYQHSSAAIAARKQLLEEAYSILSDPEKRQNYDNQFLSKIYARYKEATPTDDSIPPPDDSLDVSGIEIQDTQLAGALLLLHELGEYDLVLEIGKPYISRGILDLKRPYTGSALSEADIVLTISLAYLELGREYWRQLHYEQAAHSLQEGLEMLLREGLFSEVQSQIRADLYRLRPYRILELLALPLSDQAARSQGLSLLSEMLTERRGIDGTGNDQSGLSIDDFLMFIQQLRDYLTVAEQQEIFEAEARRPSAVGTYLAVYTLIAHGFAQRQPALIRRAKAMLRRLNIHQDVYLEQASCTLLLGQTQEALEALEQSRDYEALSFIREQSEGSPDLIPGIYHYTQRWLQDEVFPHFRDLAEQAVSVKDYFADPQIQVYLDALEADPPSAPLTEIANRAEKTTVESLELPKSPEAPLQSVTQKQSLLDPLWDFPSLPASDGVAPLRPLPLTRGGSSNGVPELSRQPKEPSLTVAERVTTGPSDKSLRSRTQKSRPVPTTVYRLRLAGLLLLAAFMVGGIVAIAYTLWRNSHPPSPPQIAASPPAAALSPSPTVSPAASPLPASITTLSSPVPETTPPPSPIRAVALSPDQAQQVIQDWQRLKAAALGKEHATENLRQILVEPALSRWQGSAQEGQANQTYWQYQLNNLQVKSVQEVSPDLTKVVAQVSETAKFYRQGQLQSEQSYTDNYQVRYTLVRQGNQWLIKSMKVIQ